MGDEVLDTFGRRLKAARKAAGLNQAQLAELAGIGQGTLSAIETDQHGSGYAPELAAALSVEAMWLKTGKGPRRRAGGTLDVSLLKDVLVGIEMGLEGRSVPPERRAEYAAALYRMFSKSEAKPDPAEILHFLRTMA